MNRFLAHAALGICLLFSGIAYSEEVATLGRIERLDGALDRQASRHAGHWRRDGESRVRRRRQHLVSHGGQEPGSRPHESERLVSCSGYGGAQSMKLLIDRRPVAGFRSGTLASMQPECSELRR